MAVDTSRIDPKKQSIKDAYEVPDNFLEIDVCNPQTHGVGNKRYTDYEVRMRVSLSFVISWRNVGKRSKIEIKL